jgi:hypothetical protein
MWDLQCLGVLENRFVYEGQPGYEIVFVYAGRLNPLEPVPDEGGWLSDNGAPIWVEWRLLAAPGGATRSTRTGWRR